MDLHHLRVFQAVARANGFTRASEELHLSQSTISQHIKQLEYELGCALFMRTGRRVVLSSAGQVLLQHTERIFNSVRNAEFAVREIKSLQKGFVRIGAISTTLIYRLPKLLFDFQKKHPHVELTVVSGSTETIAQDVRTEKIDLGIVMLPISEGGLRIHSLCREEMVVAIHAEHPAARKPVITRQELASLSFILFEKGTTIQGLIERYFARLGVVPRISMVMENVEAIKSLVRAGLGASILPRCAVNNTRDSDRIRIVRVEGYPAYRELALATIDTESLSPTVSQMAKMITDSLDDF